MGIEYIDGLEEVRWPENAPDYSSPNFAERNVQYIKKIFPDPITYDAFYGKAVFDNWILLEDTTYDTLHKSQEGHPIFLDASHALGGYKKWNENKLNWNRIDPERSIYLVGFNFDLKKFEPWLNRIDRIDNDSIKEKIAEIPEEWGVPDIYFKSINEFLTSTRNRFLPMFKEWIVFSEGNFFDVT